MPLATGTVLEGRYRVDALLGEGGMGAVYRAWDMRLDCYVALKENTLSMSPAAAEQFIREAKTLARLRHPNLPKVSDYFVLPNGAQYLVMEYVEGEDLEHLVARSGPLDEARALAWIAQVCDALNYLHNQSPPLIHRDVKPANIKITPQDDAMLVDFGIIKVGDAQMRTATGAVGVTPGYSPPEQYGAGGTDVPSDIYALGATLYTMLTGATPPESVNRAIGTAALPPPQALCPDVSPRVASAIEVAMATSPTDRPATVAEFQARLQTRPAVLSPAGASSDSQALQALQAWSASLPAWALWGGIGAVAVVGLLVILAGASKGGGTSPPPTRSLVPTATPVRSQALEASPTPVVTPREDASQVFGKDGTVMVYIPAGEFQMGSTDAAIQAAVEQCVADGLARDQCEGAYDDEQPVHPVALDAFWMGQTEVSVAQFRAFVRAVGYRTEAERQGWGWVLTGEAWEQVEGADWQHPDGPDSRTYDEHPVVQVSWNDATAYCAWVDARLPTEAEWAYAARGPGGRIYPWGDAFDCARGNFDDETRVDAYVVPGGTGCDGYVRTAPVGSYPTGASPYGVLDMAGNVWEWVADWYGAYPEGRQVNPTGPEMGESRVVRGGAFITGPNVLRAANRYHHEPAYRCNEIGFRCVTADAPLE